MSDQNSPENVLRKLGLDQYTPEELALRALDEVSRMCKGKDWQMSIPAKGTDSDIIISEAVQALLRQVSLLKAQNAFHPRAAKLMRKRKEFVVVAIDEPYFRDVYDLIRDHEMDKGTWEIGDQNCYVDSLAKNRALLVKEKL